MPSKISDLYSKDDATMIVYPNIVAANIPSSSITADKVADGAITAAKVNDGAISAVKLASGSVTAAKIASAAITTGKLDAEAVTEAKIANGAVTTAKLGSQSVTAAKIAAEAVTADKVKLINQTIRDYMDAQGLSFTLANLANLIKGKIASGFSFYWKDDVTPYVESLLAGVDDDGFVYFMGVRMGTAPSPLTDRTETTLLDFEDDSDVSYFMNGAPSDHLFMFGIGN